MLNSTQWAIVLVVTAVALQILAGIVAMYDLLALASVMVALGMIGSAIGLVFLARAKGKSRWHAVTAIIPIAGPALGLLRMFSEQASEERGKSLQTAGIVLVIVGLLESTSPSSTIGPGLCVIGVALIAAHRLRARKTARYIVLAAGIVSGCATMIIGANRQANSWQSARISKAQADVRALASAVEMYRAHYGALPPRLDALTVPGVNARGLASGPFLASVPTPPTSWTSYAYTTAADGTFTISASGDNAAARAP